MADVQLRPSAESDFIEIGEYTRKHWSQAQAELYLQRLLQVIRQIGEQPLSGQALGPAGLGYRRRRAGSHIVFYVVVPNGSVEVVRILHEKSDALRHLDPSE
ncbi:type II toxin-antitoxin system RelE/ParE family toxin [Rhizobium sp. 0TCS1.26]|uniref:type II toxin-antitoxin system RelE/ParE family toxin n=1 Tax=Rhizobium sp. 0TCS1.26 TaxID=3142623 RepID=UPI003D28FE68